MLLQGANPLSTREIDFTIGLADRKQVSQHVRARAREGFAPIDAQTWH
jgi:hypothetical protein